MQIDLRQVIDEPFRWRTTEEVAAAALDREELVSLGPISWSGVVEHTPPEFLLTARLRYVQEVRCTRCLEPVELPVEAEVELALRVQPGPPAAGEFQLVREELDLLVLEEERVDLGPILLEQLQLHVPMRALCREDCRGLCPRCGRNRNEEPCDCADTRVDPRWAALAALRDDG